MREADRENLIENITQLLLAGLYFCDIDNQVAGLWWRMTVRGFVDVGYLSVEPMKHRNQFLSELSL